MTLKDLYVAWRGIPVDGSGEIIICSPNMQPIKATWKQALEVYGHSEIMQFTQGFVFLK